MILSLRPTNHSQSSNDGRASGGDVSSKTPPNNPGRPPRASPPREGSLAEPRGSAPRHVTRLALVGSGVVFLLLPHPPGDFVPAAGDLRSPSPPAGLLSMISLTLADGLARPPGSSPSCSQGLPSSASASGGLLARPPGSSGPGPGPGPVQYLLPLLLPPADGAARASHSLCGCTSRSSLPVRNSLRRTNGRRRRSTASIPPGDGLASLRWSTSVVRVVRRIINVVICECGGAGTSPRCREGAQHTMFKVDVVDVVRSTRTTGP